MTMTEHLDDYTVGLEWQDEALCRGFSDLMLPTMEGYVAKATREKQEQQAKALCYRCPVRMPCLDHAVETREPLGIWGGMNPAERRQLRSLLD